MAGECECECESCERNLYVHDFRNDYFRCVRDAVPVESVVQLELDR
jgi:hypothetical protein